MTWFDDGAKLFSDAIGAGAGIIEGGAGLVMEAVKVGNAPRCVEEDWRQRVSGQGVSDLTWPENIFM